MRALLATQFSIVPHGGRYYTKSAFAAILRRYGAAFGPLTLCVPVKQTWSPLLEDVTEAVSQLVPVSRNDSILRRQRREMTRAIRESDLVIVRCHSFVAFWASDLAHRLKKPVLAEAMSCPWDAMWNHGPLGTRAFAMRASMSAARSARPARTRREPRTIEIEGIIMNKLQKKQAALARRHRRVRGKIAGTAARPRVCVTRSNSNMYVQVIDDVAGKTICGVSTLGPDFKATGKSGATVEGAAALGAIVGKKAQESGVTEVVFDRGGNLYHGRIKALADAAREAGLKF